jgi:hypothetical protein
MWNRIQLDACHLCVVRVTSPRAMASRSPSGELTSTLGGALAPLTFFSKFIGLCPRLSRSSFVSHNDPKTLTFTPSTEAASGGHSPECATKVLTSLEPALSQAQPHLSHLLFGFLPGRRSAVHVVHESIHAEWADRGRKVLPERLPEQVHRNIGEATNTLMVCEKNKKRGDVAPSTFLCGLTAGKTFQREAEKPRGARMPRLYQCFNHRF